MECRSRPRPATNGMKFADLKKKSEAELQRELNDAQGKLQRLRFDLAGGKVKNVREVRVKRKEVAQLLTMLRQLKK